ncbi:hypothetical protein MPTK1_3g21840 [Marchantia polymorpha subsp. ruderalis]|uniref:TOD1/MUCI70 glycosyltransferase-like domain-containing protein n=2 Tax=Marchantia polymorpha TaxID=3197 RepID=A0AAF6B3D4_MARPO|nr:hypothetical protein MARPO_0089s0032 [Marchantia polymorpha]BBN06518.1 hypothetical protein Mp_3g21840 [Marchantia polymorpha subsp. ruderalis]|eukprot:PTQ33400.1 hypothetical protein MARPO_0089s0032 [Marchantia polymorpha]
MRRQSKNWTTLRMLASRGAGMWAALMLALLSLLMIVNNFHIISFHFRQSPFARDLDGSLIITTMQKGWGEITSEEKSEAQTLEEETQDALNLDGQNLDIENLELQINNDEVRQALLDHEVEAEVEVRPPPRQVRRDEDETHRMRRVEDIPRRIQHEDEPRRIPRDDDEPLRFREDDPHRMIHEDDPRRLQREEISEDKPHHDRSLREPPPTQILVKDNRTRAAPVLYLDTSLPPDHPCQGFTFPPPPADKKRTGPRPCPVCYLPVDQAIKAMPPGPTRTPVLKHLTYIREPEIADVLSTGSGSEFGGHPTLEDRAQSYTIRENMAVHCGFVKGSDPGVGTGYDISEEDRAEMHKCGGVVVGSAIFGNYDDIQQPANISAEAKANVCFFMFIDEETGRALLTNADLRSTRKIGLWRLVVVKNLPYTDARRTGKIPKLLIHRLFPNARYSLWVDGKLQLVVDPYQILERFLWRTNDTIAISRHYKRFDVFVEAEANKAAGKYDNATIDAQVDFYRSEGMTPYSEEKLPITSDVPEGCVIIREHTPLSNLFGCLWFNEVDRFTSRDQISFGIVRDKMMAQVPWRINMFLDCERRNFVVQGYHRDVLEQKMQQQAGGTAKDPKSDSISTQHRLSRSRRLRSRSL